MPVQRGFIPGPMGGPYPGPQGGIQGFGPAGAQGFQQPVASQLVEGINNFVANFRDQKEKNKERALKEFMTGISLKEKGIPQDDKKLAKKAREAGLDFDYEGPTPMEKAEAEFQEQQQAFQQQQQAAMGSMMAPQLGMNRAMEAGAPIPGMMPLQGPPRPGQMGMPPGAVMQGGPMPAPNLGATPLPGMMPQMQTPPPAPPVRQPGILGRIGQALTGGPPQGPIPADAGIMQALAQIGKQGQQQQRITKIQGLNAEKLHKLATVYIDDPYSKDGQRARDILSNTPDPFTGKPIMAAMAEDERFVRMAERAHPEDPGLGVRAMIADVLGQPEMERQIMTAAIARANQFGDSVEKAKEYFTAVWRGKKTSIKPEMSLEETIELRQRAGQLMERYPEMDVVVAEHLASLPQGTAEYVQKYLAVANRFKTKEALEAGRFAQGQKMDLARLQQQWTIHTQQRELAKAQEMRQVSQGRFDDAYKIWSAKDVDQETKNAAVRELVETLNQRGAGVSTKRLTSWFGFIDSGSLGIGKGAAMPDAELESVYTGVGPDIGGGMEKTLAAFLTWAKRMNEKNGTEIRPDDFMSYMGIGKGF